MFRFAFIGLLILASQVSAKSPSEELAAALKEDKPVFLYFGAKWCGPCQQMKRTTLSNTVVKTTLTEYSVIIVDIDEQKALSNQYNITAVPTYMVIVKTKTIKTMAGSTSPDAFLKWLK